MAIEPKKINFDVAIKSTNHTRSYALPPEVYTSDANAVQFRFNILDVTEEEFVEGAAVSTIEITTRDGSIFQKVGDTALEGTTIVYDLKENEGNHAGVAKIQLVLQLGTKKFTSDEYKFKIINNIASAVPVEIYVQNWGTLTSQAEAYITQMAQDIEDFDVALETGVLATNIAAKLQSLESTYAPEIVSMRAQLADTLNKSAITLTHMFADNTARDAYFVAHPTELVELQFIKVGTGYQQYIEGTWQASTAIVAEQLSATNQPIVDTGNYFNNDNTNAALQELGAHKASTANPHATTKAQVELGNVDNTSDANKPVSTAMQTALNLKADKTTTDGLNTRLTAEETATANNKVSEVKGKTFANVDARFEELETQAITVDARTEFEANNLGINTYPLSDTTGWGSNTGVSNITAASGVISGLVANGFFYTNVNNFISTPNAIGDKIYSCGKVQAVTKVDSGNISSVQLHDTVKPMVYDTWIALSGIKTTTMVLSYVSFQFVSSEYATAVGRTIKVKDAVHINLTKVFGAGKEPTLAEMDRLMERFPNRWFDGVKPIQTIETLYQEKANKAQEAWITPTLVNSWVAFDTRTAKYKKADYGRVYLKGLVKNGTIGAIIFTLPTGYRPDEALIFGVITVNTDGTVVCTSGANTSVSLSGVNFFV